MWCRFIRIRPARAASSSKHRPRTGSNSCRLTPRRRRRRPLISQDRPRISERRNPTRSRTPSARFSTVASYSLGAFTLSSVDAVKAQATAGVGVAGVGGTAKHTDDASALKKGGDLAACTTFDQHACRVPIRVLLRKVADGARPGVTPVTAAAPAAPAPADMAGQMAAAQAMIDGIEGTA